MQTITPPLGPVPATAPDPIDWTPPQAFTAFEVTCANPGCRAELLVDSPDDIVYRVKIVFYAEDVSYLLAVVCPHCEHYTDLEGYREPGNPARHAKGQPDALGVVHRPARHYHCVPDAVRSRAYKRWESAQTRSYWDTFFLMRDVRDWAKTHTRAARKMKARLLP